MNLSWQSKFTQSPHPVSHCHHAFELLTWSAATRFIVSSGHSSHHLLIPGVSAAWVPVTCGTWGAPQPCSTRSGLVALVTWSPWWLFLGPPEECPQGRSSRVRSGGAPTAPTHLTDGTFGQKLLAGAGNPVRQPPPDYQPFGCGGSPLARLRHQNRQNLYQKHKSYFRLEIFLSSSVHVKIKSSCKRWLKKPLKLVNPRGDLLQQVFTVPCRWSGMSVKLKVAWDQPWNSRSSGWYTPTPRGRWRGWWGLHPCHTFSYLSSKFKWFFESLRSLGGRKSYRFITYSSI